MRQYEFMNKLLISLATATGGAGMTLQNIDLTVGLILKGTSLIAFVCYILINQDAISTGWSKFKNRFKRKNNGTKIN